MNWHSKNKLVIRRIAVAITVIMWIILISEVNLMGVQYVSSYEETNVFTKEWFLADISTHLANLFSSLYVIVLALFGLSWKGMGENKRAGIWLYNGALATFVAWLLGYIGITYLVVEISSWYTILCAFVAVVFGLCVLCNVIYYSKNKENMAEDSRLKLPAICFVATVVVVAVLSFNFIKKCDAVWNDKYGAICKNIEGKASKLVDDEITYEDYVRLQYANYFNPEGKHFSIEEFEQAVKNYNSGEGSWYALWYVWDSRGCVTFYDYDFEDSYWDFYIKYVTRELEVIGIAPEAATYQELDTACKTVYDVYASQVVKTYLGDEESEIVINIEVPESGKAEDVKISCQSEGYYAVVDEWYKVADKGEKTSDRDDAAEILEKGCIYKASIQIYTRIGYSFIPMNDSNYIKVEYNGATTVHDNGINNGIKFDGADYIYDQIYIVVD